MTIPVWSLANQAPISRQGSDQPVNIPAKHEPRLPPRDNGLIQVIDVGKGAVAGYIKVEREEVAPTVVVKDVDPLEHGMIPVDQVHNYQGAIPVTTAQPTTSILSAFAPPPAIPPAPAEVNISSQRRPRVVVVVESADAPGQLSTLEFEDVLIEGQVMIFVSFDPEATFLAPGQEYGIQIADQPVFYLVSGTALRFSYAGQEFGFASIVKTIQKPTA
jgi:hypothetical protein